MNNCKIELPFCRKVFDCAVGGGGGSVAPTRAAVWSYFIHHLDPQARFSVFLRQLSASGSNTKLLSSVNATSKRNIKNTNTISVVHCIHSDDPSEYDAKANRERKSREAISSFWRNGRAIVGGTGGVVEGGG